MAEYRFDCRECTNEAYSARFDACYCLPMVSTGASPVELHDLGGTKNGDYLTCCEFTTAPRPLAIYEAVSVFDDAHPCNEPTDWGD